MTTETKTLRGIIQPDGVTVKENNPFQEYALSFEYVFPGEWYDDKDYSHTKWLQMFEKYQASEAARRVFRIKQRPSGGGNGALYEEGIEVHFNIIELYPEPKNGIAGKCKII